MITVYAVLAGFLADVIIGEPQNPIHPVRIIGRFIALLLGFAKKLKMNSIRFIYGAFITVLVVGLSFFLPWVLLSFLYSLHISAGFIAEAAFCYFCIAAKGLCDEGLKIYRELSQNNLSEARKKLSWIVGRDTENLNEGQIVKATVETVSENLSDGVIAPMVFMFIGGAPLALAYKAINTLDSMVGYRNETFEYLGKFSAWIDDVVNFIPARISALLMIFSAFLCRLNAKDAVRIYLRDRKNHLSPNSAQTESVCAGALTIHLGGTHLYNGIPVVKPTIGDDLRPVKPQDIKAASRLMYVSAALALAAGTAIKVIFYV